MTVDKVIAKIVRLTFFGPPCKLGPKTTYSQHRSNYKHGWCRFPCNKGNEFWILNYTDNFGNNLQIYMTILNLFYV